MKSRFTLIESFKLYDKSDHLPYNIKIQSSSNFWHKHAFPVSEGYCVACTGNKYFLDTPFLRDCEASFAFSFGHSHQYAGVSIYFGYDPTTFCGYEARIEWEKDKKTLAVRLIEHTVAEEKELAASITEQMEFPAFKQLYNAELKRNGSDLSVRIGDTETHFSSVPTKAGYVGFSRPHFIGTVTFSEASVSVYCPIQKLCEPVKVEIPLVNGGTMPLTMEYSLFEVEGKRYITATLDGGPQYRTEENYNPYPCNKKGQYGVESWFIDTPYFTYNGQKFLMKRGMLNLTDPGLAWKELQFKIMPYSLLPLSVTVPIEKAPAESFGFGYEDLYVPGYNNQHCGAEFVYSANGDYLGQQEFEDTFSLCSPIDKKAVRLIPETVFDHPTVKKHFENNHYFAEDEDIFFRINMNTKKKYITYEAELQDVYGEPIERLKVTKNGISHTPLPVGVYRILLTVYYGDEVLKTVNTVFEVFDETGEKCAPTESGLPFQFSMPNELQYGEHDPFDPWAKKASCNSEHFYPCVSFTGHVAEYKRTWEITELFGRKWYVWFSDHRSMVDHDPDKHPNIVKHADYMYYPSEYEWAVLRSDFGVAKLWKKMPKLRALLDTFLSERPGSAERIGLENGAPMTDQTVADLHKYYHAEWYAYAQKAIKEMFIRQNEMFKRDNPKLKRACYGPFNLYASPLRTTELSKMYGFEKGNTLSDVIYTGFAQLEDYPNSCAYQTYYGAFGVGASLVNSPRLVIYPEQYGSSRGGCIDGAVYFAHPPIGKVICPPWFSTTHAREFVYNTPRKADGRFEYWNTYGFMKWDFDENDNDIFVKNWKYVLKYPPSKPMKSAAFVCSFSDLDDRFEANYPSSHRFSYNLSEEGIGYLYEISRLSGLPAGFFTDWRNLNTLTENDTDVLILPSTEGLDGETLLKIRELHKNGVALIAVSSVDGLEDLFGVRKAPRTKRFNSLHTTKGEHESVYPMEETFNYESNGADCVLFASDVPAIFTYGNTALLNTSPMALGRTWFLKHCLNARTSNSPLLRTITIELMKRLSEPLATTDDCGITLFETKNSETMLLCIDYSEHDDNKIYLEKERTIWLTDKCCKNAVSIDGKPLRKLISEDGHLDGVVVTLRRHESALIQLI